MSHSAHCAMFRCRAHEERLLTLTLACHRAFRRGPHELSSLPRVVPCLPPCDAGLCVTFHAMSCVMQRVCRQVDVEWHQPQHITQPTDPGVRLEMRGWVPPESLQDRRASRIGLEAGRTGASMEEATAQLPRIEVPESASLLVAPGRRGDPPAAPSDSAAAPRGPARPVD